MATIDIKDVDGSVLAQIAQDCHVSVGDVEDVYACTPFQAGILADPTIYVERYVRSLAPSVDLDRFAAALDHVISLNVITRTRIVDCDLGLVQVVLRHGRSPWDSVRRISDLDVNTYLLHDRSVPMHLGTQLSRFAIVDRKLVLTIHHAVSDHYSLTQLALDIWSVYKGQTPSPRAPFKEFVRYCSAIDENAAVGFWKAQFKGGEPSIFPSAPPEHAVQASQRMSRHIVLKKLASVALIPAYIEAAWGLTAADYTGSEIVAFGYVMSGRSAALGGAETTLGPTIATVPLQVRLGSRSYNGADTKRTFLG